MLHCMPALMRRNTDRVKEITYFIGKIYLYCKDKEEMPMYFDWTYLRFPSPFAVP